MDKTKAISKIFFDSAVTVAPEQGDYYAKLVVRNSSKIIKMLQGKGKIKEISKIFVDSAVTVAPEQGDYYAGIVVKNSSKIIEVLQGKNEIKEEIINTTFSLEEMAMADFKGMDFAVNSSEELAMNYVKNARSRNMSDKQIASGLGATFKSFLSKMSIYDNENPDLVKINAVKAAIKKELKLPDTNKPKLKVSAIVKPTKKAKEDTVYKGTEKVRAAAKRASEVMKEEIINTTFSLEEMAVSDLKDSNYQKASPKEIAKTYIENARNRALSNSRIMAGLSSTFKAIIKNEVIDSEKAEKIKAAIKKELKLPDTNKPKKTEHLNLDNKTVTKKAKEDTVYKGTEKVKAAAKRASEVMKEDIFKNAGVNERECSCDTDKKKKDTYMSKSTDNGKQTVLSGILSKKIKELKKDKKFLQANKKEQKKMLQKILKLQESTEYSCKYCNERYDTEETLDKHQKMCVA